MVQLHHVKLPTSIKYNLKSEMEKLTKEVNCKITVTEKRLENHQLENHQQVL